ncbi:MAG: TetR/AcrR family transcriptional regulator [Alphaproteobacteria bacterium]|nr:TetR/AcrR family transcriptional regulator [Alphaproteobacteria bacterium]
MATIVLGELGSGGLTHRAVDQRAGLREGSTSNLFRTRSALVAAVCEYLTRHDLGQMREAAERFARRPGGTVQQAAAELAGIVEAWADENATYTCARLELFLIARRDKAVAADLGRARQAFRAFTAQWLDTLSAGAATHAASLMAYMEGLTMLQLFHPGERLSRKRMESGLARLLTAMLAS